MHPGTPNSTRPQGLGKDGGIVSVYEAGGAVGGEERRRRRRMFQSYDDVALLALPYSARIILPP